jgi:hypothetical protein
MSNCGCNKDQTHKDVLAFMAKNAQSVYDKSTPMLGVGLFRVPAPENGILEYKTVWADDISYNECVKRGSNCEAFQWIPKGYLVTISGNEVGLSSGADFLIDPARCTLLSCFWGTFDCPVGCFCSGLRCSY